MQSLAEWRLGRVTSETKKNKQRVNLEPPRPMAARLIKACQKDLHSWLGYHNGLTNSSE